MSRKLSRRQFLKLLATTTAGGSYVLFKLLNSNTIKSMAQDLTKKTFLPIVIAEPPTPSPEPTPTSTPIPTSSPIPPPTGSRVVHVHNTDATYWNGVATDYWNYVNQSEVDNMVNQGMMKLTGENSVAAAWQSVLPNYQVGEAIAIKVNFNNSKTCDATNYEIDAIAEPVNSVIHGLIQRGVNETDIWIYDSVRNIPNRFVSKILFEGVRYFDNFRSNYCREQAGFISDDPDAFVQFSIGGMESNRISDVLIDATYLINMPIMKKHSMAGVSLAFKHHFGTIQKPASLHDHITLWDSAYDPNYSPLVDIYNNPHIRNKTILTIGDGIFSALSTDSPPVLWQSLNNQVPNSLFFANDPVAIDSVMCDVIAGESNLRAGSDDYLGHASNAGLGVFEHGVPWNTAGYNQIDYLFEEL